MKTILGNRIHRRYCHIAKSEFFSRRYQSAASRQSPRLFTHKLGSVKMSGDSERIYCKFSWWTNLTLWIIITKLKHFYCILYYNYMLSPTFFNPLETDLMLFLELQISENVETPISETLLAGSMMQLSLGY